jgi:shikimate dehydrogenase
MTEDRSGEEAVDPWPAGSADRPRPGVAAVLGHPIAHSLSPVLHRAAYRFLGLTGWEYDLLDVAEEDLPSVVERLRTERASGTVPWAGLSLTMPLKRAVRPLLDAESELATAVGAVNTVIFTEHGLMGDNTDVIGMIRALGEVGVTRVEEAAVLGGGATATSAVASLRRLGCSSVTVHARRYSTTALLRDAAERLGIDVRVRGLDRADFRASAGASVLISTLPPSAADHLATAVTGEFCGGGRGPDPVCLLDVVYSPWPTALARRWSAAGGSGVGGLSMLIHQAAEQVRLMTGHAAPVEVMRTAGEDELARRSGEPGK